MTAELVQANFKLTTELKQLKSEVASMRARRAIDVAEEVARIKAAYEVIEQEVVALRQESIRFKYSEVVEVPMFEASMESPSETSGVISMLSDQLEEERTRFSDLEQRYRDLRKEFQETATKSVSYYSEPSTCVGSPVYKAGVCSVEQFERIVIKAEMFAPPAPTARRTLPAAAEAPAAAAVAPVRQKRAPQDQSLQRLSKIARFRPS